MTIHEQALEVEDRYIKAGLTDGQARARRLRRHADTVRTCDLEFAVALERLADRAASLTGRVAQ